MKGTGIMNIQKILSAVDHTLLSPAATQNEIFAVCDEAIQYHTASVCIPPACVAAARGYVGDRMRICTVIGFPNGYHTTAVKVYEAQDAVKNGADELDLVINIGWLKDKRYTELLTELKAVKEICPGVILKVIVETCLLNEEEKIKVCGLVAASGADYIKTSTGFSSGGATKEDIRLFAAHRAPTLKIKAAGGISSLEDAEIMLSLGADRLGTSRLIKLAREAGYSGSAGAELIRGR